MTKWLRLLAALGLIGCLPLVGGCFLLGKPESANVLLRKKNQALQEKVSKLEEQRRTDQGLIRSLRSDRPTVPTLPPERLDQLFTTHGLKFGRLTGGIDLDRSRPGDEAVKVYVVPTDESGQALKAAGSFTIEAYDLSEPLSPLVGRWTFSIEQARQNWYGALLDYGYVFTLPFDTWLRSPQHEDITLKVTFLDALTGLPFGNQTQVKVKFPPATRPSPSTQPLPSASAAPAN